MFPMDPNFRWAWTSTVGSMRISEEEMQHFGELSNDSAELEHGGYLASFRVFHELHCMVD